MMHRTPRQATRLPPIPPRAMSLVYILVLMGVTFAMVSGVIQMITHAGELYDNQIHSKEAYDAGISLRGKARQEVKANGLGYENPASGQQNLYDLNGDEVFDVYGNYEIWARAKKVAWRTEFLAGDLNYASCDSFNPCIAPIPGTGNAGVGCDFTDPFQGWAPSATVTAAQALDNDCNWNKLHYGEVVSFPLYYEVDPSESCDVNGNGICNPAEAPIMSTFILRVRTPDTDGDGMRETLSTLIDLNGDGDTNDTGENDPVVVNWEITGDCDTNDDGDADDPNDESCWLIGVPRSPFALSAPYSLIYASKVNTATSYNYEVLDGSYLGNDHNQILQPTVSEFLTENESTIGYEILNPLLTISVVTLLEEMDLTSVPYLEYQIQVDKPISDNKSSIHSYGKSKLKKPYGRHFLDYLGIAENPLIQFVIQN